MGNSIKKVNKISFKSSFFKNKEMSVDIIVIRKEIEKNISAFLKFFLDI